MYTLKEKSLVLQDRVKALIPLLKVYEENEIDAEKFGLSFLKADITSSKKIMDAIIELTQDMSNQINELFTAEEDEHKKQEDQF